MKEGNHLERLLALQEIDVEIVALEDRRDAVPGRRAAAAGEITVLEEEEARREAELERVRLDRRQLESELEAVQERLARYDRQLSEVKTNVAYSALLSEIQAAKREASALEDQILELMGIREENDARLEEIRAELVTRREAARDTLEALAAEAADLERRLVEVNARRTSQVEGVDAVHLRMYDRLRRRRRFPALVALKGHACGSCFGSMPPQVVQEVTHDGTLHLCEACGAIVYSDAALTAGSAAGLGESPASG